jgi:glutathione S-transferase
MWPAPGSPEDNRARSLMSLERKLFGCWCNLVFRGPGLGRPMKQFEECMNEVEDQLKVTSGPWFLDEFSIVDLTYITHIERMCASVAFWCGIKIRGDGLWPAIERWISAFEDMSSYMATKSDYYTHMMDIPPQYGPGYFMDDSARTKFAPSILGEDGSWSLPLSPTTRPGAVEPVRAQNDPGDQAAREEAAFKLTKNYEAVVKFALRGAGVPGTKRFQAPLADPYAVPALEYQEDVDALLRYVIIRLMTYLRALLNKCVHSPTLGCKWSYPRVPVYVFSEDF